MEEENEHSHEEETVLHTNQPALPNLEYDPSKYQDDYNEETDFPVNDSSIVIRSQQVHSRHGSSDSVKSTTTTTQLQQHHHRRLKIGNHDDDEDGDSLAKLQSEIDQYMKSQQHMDSEHEADAAVMLLEQSAPAAEGQSGPARSADHHHILNSNATGNIHRSNVTNSRLVDASTTASNIYDGGFGEEEESLTTNHQRPPLAAASSPHYAAHDEKDNGDEFIAHHQSIIDNNSKKASNHSNDSLVSRGTTSAWHDDLNTLSRNMSEMSLPPPLPDELSASHHNLPIVGGGVAGSSRPSSRPSSRLYAIDAKRGVSREGIHLSQKSSSSPGVSTTQPATTTASTKLSTFANRPSTSSSSKGWGGIDSTETTAMKIRGASAEDSKVVQECIHSLSIQMHHDQLVTAAVSSVVKKPASARSIIETRQVVSEIRALQAVAEKIEARSLYAYDVPPVINNSAVAVAPAAEPSRPSSAEIRLKSSSSSRSRKKSSASSGGGSRSASRQSKAHPMLPTIDEIAHTPTDTVAIPGSLAKDDDGGEEVGLWANNGSSSYERVRRDFVSESLPQSRHGRLETSFNTEDVHHGAVIIHQRSSSMPSADDDDLIEKILQRSLESIKQLQLESVREMEASAAAAAQAAEVFNEVIESTSSAIHLQQQELLEQGEVEVVREDAEEEDKKEEGGDGKPNMVIAHHEAEPPISESHRNLVGDVDKKVENEDNDGEEPFNVVLEGSFAPPSPLHLNQNNMEEESSGEEEAEEEEEAISTSAAINNPSSNSTTSSAPPKSSSPSSNPKTPSSLKDRTKELVIEVSDEEDAGDDTLELLYDPETDLYYDPLTNKHYKLDDDNDEED